MTMTFYADAPALSLKEAERLTGAGMPRVADIRNIYEAEMEHAALRARTSAERAEVWRAEAASATRAVSAAMKAEAADLLQAASAAFSSAEAELEEAIERAAAALDAVPELRAAWNTLARTPRAIASRYGGADRDNPAWLDAARQYAVPHGWVTAAEAAALAARVAADEASKEAARLEYQAACAYSAAQGRGGQVID